MARAVNSRHDSIGVVRHGVVVTPGTARLDYTDREYPPDVARLASSWIQFRRPGGRRRWCQSSTKPSARATRAGVIGSRVMRAPVASSMAFATAAAGGAMGGSP